MKPCTICGNDKADILFTRPEWQVVRCAQCGLVYVNFPDPSKKPKHSEDYSDSEEPDELGKRYMQEVFIDRHEMWMTYWRGKVQAINRVRPDKRGRVLDIGTAMGHFLLAAREDGWEPVGVELSRPQVVFARKEFGLEVYADYFENLEFPPASFDVITLWNVIEHLDDPGLVARQAHTLLKPGGLFVVETPNQDSFITWLAGMAYHLSGGRTMLDVYSDDHLYRFSRDTLGRLLESCGYRVVHMNIEDNLDLMLARMSMRPYKLLRRILLTGVHGIARVLGKQNQLFAMAERVETVEGKAGDALKHEDTKA